MNRLSELFKCFHHMTSLFFNAIKSYDHTCNNRFARTCHVNDNDRANSAFCN